MESWRDQPVVFWTFLLPGGLWLLCFFLAPLALVWAMSFGERAGPVDIVITGTLENYLKALDPLYLGLLWKSFWIAALATALTLVIAFPVALAVSFAPPRAKPLLLMLVILPFWTSFLIRVYAWIGILKNEGLLNALLLWLGVISEPLVILNTNVAVYIGIIYSYLPFMVLPIYASFDKMDASLVEAAVDLGCRPTEAFRRITVPIALPGIVAGSLLVFIPAVGEFVIPDLLGGSETLMIGRTLWVEFFNNRDWPLASAVATVLLLVLVLPIMYFQRSQAKLEVGDEKP
jgi:putrescine transport system permease protein